ncbi:MAG: hypothetical protein FJX76_12740 [Armatimonadetes bacterium]|nr:hypothetical protein [Armatimonadota bacterium]
MDAEEPAPPASPVFPWRQEQPALFRLTSPSVPADLMIGGENNRVARYAVVEVMRDIEAEPRYSFTAQANIDSRNALAVLLPNIF